MYVYGWWQTTCTTDCFAQAWRTRRADGSWEWEWEYEAREAAAGRGDKARSVSPQWRGDYKPQVDEAGRELPRSVYPVDCVLRLA